MSDKIFITDKCQIDKQSIFNLFNNLLKSSQDEKLKELYTEWKLVTYIINNNEYIEISKKTKNNKRLYMNNNGDWVVYNVPKKYNKFITCIKYAYSD